MRTGRLVQLVAGVVLVVVGMPLLVAGLTLGWLRVFVQDDDGWFNTSTEHLTTPTVALVSDDVDLGGAPGDWIPFDDDIAAVRIHVGGDEPLFVGIGPAAAVDRYLTGASHDIVDGVFEPGPVEQRTIPGEAVVARPADQTFWVAAGDGDLTWDIRPGRWNVVVMRVDGTAGVIADATAGLQVAWSGPAGLGLLLAGLVLIGGGAWAVISAARTTRPGSDPHVGRHAVGSSPMHIEGALDEPLSRWLWLVKWVLAIPHLVVLVPLWIGFLVTTVAAFFAILVTGRYPRALFDFGVGVMRWTWRVGFYAFSAIATDKYPPFSLAADESYPADLRIARPERLSRGLVLVKWWLLAIPQYLVLLVLTGGIGFHVGGVVTALVLVTGVVLLASGSYPPALFDVIMGCNRWAYRVLAYVLLMTDEYPPFRFDAGGRDAGTAGPTDGDQPDPHGPSETPPERTLVDIET